MNLGLDALPDVCDVLVVGAGPAGSAAALTLARSGMSVVLIDQQAFPRDKVCGDALIPDAHQALRDLGVHGQVMQCAQHVAHVACVAPRGGRVDLSGELAVLPRKVLDDIVCRAAVAAGARMHAPVRFLSTIEVDGVVVGARLQQGEQKCSIQATWVLLATGAVPQALIAAGMVLRQAPSGVALRAYIKNDAMVGRIDRLEIVWHRALRPGYGWIFPCGDGVFNMGVGISEMRATRAGGRHAKGEANLRQIYEQFSQVHTPARELLEGGVLVGDVKGAPLRFSLEGARLSRPGLLVCGEAAGSTYAFTGEGIGKALRTGMLAANAIVEGKAGCLNDAQVRSMFEAAVNALKPRFQMYQRANVVNRQPWLADLVVWRAGRSGQIRRRLSGLLDETSHPGHLWTARGVFKLFTE